MKMTEWYRQGPIQEDISTLCNPNLPLEDRNFINILVMNIVLKYLSVYLGVFSHDIDEVKSSVEGIINSKYDSRPQFNFELLTGNPISNDLFAIDCLSDLQSTSAIFKEIAMNSGFNKTDSFTGIDFGSGTGILSLAMYIASMRKGITSGKLILVDNVNDAINKSKIILSGILGGRFDIDTRKGDLTDQDFFRGLGIDSKGVNYVVSETISCTTPAFTIDTGNGEIICEDKFHIRENELNRYLDPYPTILSYIIRFYPELYERISSGVAMFPNPRNRQIIPDSDKTRVRLQSGLIPNNYLLLHRLGDEFGYFQSLSHTGPKRWNDPQEMQDLYRELEGVLY